MSEKFEANGQEYTRTDWGIVKDNQGRDCGYYNSVQDAKNNRANLGWEYKESNNKPTRYENSSSEQSDYSDYGYSSDKDTSIFTKVCNSIFIGCICGFIFSLLILCVIYLFDNKYAIELSQSLSFLRMLGAISLISTFIIFIKTK